MIRLEPGDMLSVIPRLVAEGVVCDACVTDPPYHLLPTNKRFGAPLWNNHPKGPRFKGSDDGGQYARLTSGFMGQQWDGGDIAFRPETWATVATILRPGSFLIAFGGTRTYHRLVTAIEDAGFIIQDQVAWLFGSGFPKRRDMLKPAFEPICLAYKPGGKRTLQVDECRIATDGEAFHVPQSDPANRQGVVGLAIQAPGSAERNQAAQRASIERTQTLGRWPANVCHDGSEEVIEAFPESGSSKAAPRGGTSPCPMSWGDGRQDGEAVAGHNDTGGSAARFFYCAKADKQDRWGSRHPTVKPVELMKWLVPLVTPPIVLFCERCDNSRHENRTKTASGVTSVRSVRSALSATGQSSAPQILFKDMRAEGNGAVAAPSLRAVRDDVQAKPSVTAATLLLKEVQHEGHGGEAGERLCDVATRIPAVASAGSSEGNEVGLHNGTSASGRGEDRAPAAPLGSGASHQRPESGQPPGEPRGSGEGGARCYPQARTEADQVPALRRDDKSLGTCPACGGYLTSRPGLVLDPFAGSGTTGVAALATGRDCILIEREDQYIADIKERLAFYEGGGTHSVQAKNRSRSTDSGPLFA